MNPNSPPRLAFVIATKDRPDDLRKTLRSLESQTHAVAQIVIVDSGETVESTVAEFPRLTIQYLRHEPPSAAAQRNAGIDAVDPTVDLVGFLDDDIVMEPDAVEKMIAFWLSVPDDLAGAAFNMLNPIPMGGRRLKTSRFVNALGLFAGETGRVAPSGWQNVPETVAENTFTDWLPTTAVVWRRKIVEQVRFDEFFEGYSYLEDLDFSYSARRLGRLAIVADARYHHFPSKQGRISRYRFGRIEVANRLFFVRKHELSIWRCYLGLAIRFGMTALEFLRYGRWTALQRMGGNLRELPRQCWIECARTVHKKGK